MKYILILTLLLVGCEIDYSRYNQEKPLRRIGETETYWLYTGIFSSTAVPEQGIQFTYESFDYPGRYVTKILPIEKVLVKIDNSIDTPTVKLLPRSNSYKAMDTATWFINNCLWQITCRDEQYPAQSEIVF